ncbi:MAG: cardiolipin synthase [Gammaproteobacteria bacterium]|nr:MAG: cardiolipin synthase [Gammaproteobacteria bacterium]
MSEVEIFALALLLLDIGIVVSIMLRVIVKRRPPGVSLAWLILVILLPYVGAVLYLLVGERTLGRKRARRARQLLAPLEEWLAHISPASAVPREGEPIIWEKLQRFVAGDIGLPALGGNQMQLIEGASATLEAIIEEIDAAHETCDMEFYIWHLGGLADDVARALIRAQARGVRCRVLIDSVGSAAFLRSRLAREMRQGGVEIIEALPVGLLRSLFVRVDLRLHRKIVVVDGSIAFTGSLNLVDPRFFKQGNGVGEWVDAMVRVTGPAVKLLELVFVWDWLLETGETLESLIPVSGADLPEPTGIAVAQVLPSGPVYEGSGVYQVLLTAIYSARRELIMTTPYFVPDEPVLEALMAAARRGVEVTLIVPERVDSVLVRYASRAYNDDLLSAGVRILRFRGGLLHTKSVVVDGDTTLFGTVNLDIRSLRLNFEVTVIAYDAPFGHAVRELQMSYAAQSEPIDLQRWRRRRKSVRLLENMAQLMSPLL